MHGERSISEESDHRLDVGCVPPAVEQARASDRLEVASEAVATEGVLEHLSEDLETDELRRREEN